jgi:diguanylate cyclase (GGDEF)-like protein/putative nucleotidyltransferase with HDIG domain
MNIYIFVPLFALVIYISIFVPLAAYRPWKNRHKYFAITLAGAIAWNLSNILFRSEYFMDYKLLLSQITICSFFFMIIPFSYFITTFYRKPTKNWLFLAYVPLLSSIVLAALGYLPQSIVFGPSVYPVYNMPLLLITVVLPLVILAIKGVYKLHDHLMHAETPLVYNQIMYLIFAIVLLVLFVSSNLFLRGRQLPIAHMGSLLIALILAYAILKHQLIDIKLFFRKGIAYSGLIIFVAAIYFILFHIAFIWLDFKINTASVAMVTIISGVITISFYPLLNIVQRKVDHLFYGSTYDYRHMLMEFSKKASNILKLDDLANELTNLTAAAVSARRAYLIVFDPSNEERTTQFISKDMDKSNPPKIRLERYSPIINWLKKEKRILFRDNLDVLPEISSLWATEKQSIISAEIELFAPLINRDKLIGILMLAKKKHRATYDISDIELINALTSEIAIAIENAQLHAKITTQAITDDLTGLFNRRYFDERLNEEIARHNRYGGTFSLILYDLDYFKQYNDTNGHNAGDKLLKEITRNVNRLLRNVDMVFRYGGDEFAIIVPETSSEDALSISERVRTSVVAIMETRNIGVTISMGIASFPTDGAMVEDLIQAADAALYQAKQSGGNQTAVFSQLIVSPLGHAVSRICEEKNTLNAIRALVTAVDTRDHYTEHHSQQVALYAGELAAAAGLPQAKIATLKTAAMLHDIGKISIPDDILNKTGILTPEECRIFQSHSSTGVSIISHISSLTDCIPIILHHHERFDGSGYPDRLKGEEIPLEARILSIADAFSAMLSERPHRRALSIGEAIQELKFGSGTQFDPYLTELFIPIAPGLTSREKTEISQRS